MKFGDKKEKKGLNLEILSFEGEEIPPPSFFWVIILVGQQDEFYRGTCQKWKGGGIWGEIEG